jgi:hypothetical protein
MRLATLWAYLRRSLRFWLDAWRRAFNPPGPPAADLRRIACARCGAGFTAAELRPVDLGFLCGPCDAAELAAVDLARIVSGPEFARATCCVCARAFRVHRDTLVYCALARQRWHCAACGTVARILA